MKLGEKIRYLREVEGSLRGLGRPMTQLELVRAIEEFDVDAVDPAACVGNARRFDISVFSKAFPREVERALSDDQRRETEHSPAQRPRFAWTPSRR